MKLVSVSGVVCYVKDMAKTATFYKSLGFRVDTDEPDHLSVGLNWFWIDFHPQDKEDKPDFQQEATLEPKGAGLFLYIKVDDVDECYQNLLDKGFKPSGQPRDWPWGNREFVIRDPDGYKLVFFTKIR
jgi:catechol 2,3-dioxygenase-like lactoylglutathione lyase family enzyme